MGRTPSDKDMVLPPAPSLGDMDSGELFHNAHSGESKADFNLRPTSGQQVTRGCCDQAIALKFRLLSLRFTSEEFENGRKMSVIESRVENRRSDCSLPVAI
jgi:hypothetical protein